MINSISKEQEELIPSFIKQAMDLQTKPLNHKKSDKAVDMLYKLINKPTPVKLYFSSPTMCVLAYNLINSLKKINMNDWLGSQLGSQLESQLWSQLDSQLWSQLRSQLKSQLWSQLWSQLDSQLGSQLGSQLESQLDSQLWSQLDSQLDSQLWSQLDSQLRSQLDSQLDSQLGSQLRSQLGSQLESQLWSQLDSQLWSQLRSQLKSQLWSQLGSQLESQLWIFSSTYDSYYYKYLSLIVNKTPKELDDYMFISDNLFIIQPYENICFISERPVQINKNDQGQLHKDGDLAVKFSDGTGVYALNGVVMPKEIVETPAGNLDSKFLTQTTNADVKAEFIRKYGIDRLSHEGKIVDSHKNYNEYWWTKSEYELIDMASLFSRIRYAPHLKMRNQTTGVYHLEAVHPTCLTIKDALEQTRWNGRKIQNYKTENIK